MFDVAVGERAISAMGHVKMMAAAQPFISGAISKTVNLPESVTVEDIADVYTEGWKLGLKALAIYRDGSKTAQALKTDGGTKTAEEAAEAAAVEPARPVRRRMPSERQSLTHKFSIGGHEGYITAGEYEDGTVGEIFLTDVGKEGSTIKGMMNAFATAISIGLQYGVPLETLRAEVRLRALRAGGHHRQPGDPVREVDARLHHALAGLPLRRRRPARGAGHPHRRDPGAQGVRGRRSMRGDTAGPAGAGRTEANGRRNGGNGGDAHARRRAKPAAAALRTSRRRSRRSCRAWSWARPARCAEA